MTKVQECACDDVLPRAARRRGRFRRHLVPRTREPPNLECLHPSPEGLAAEVTAADAEIVRLDHVEASHVLPGNLYEIDKNTARLPIPRCGDVMPLPVSEIWEASRVQITTPPIRTETGSSI